MKTTSLLLALAISGITQQLPAANATNDWKIVATGLRIVAPPADAKKESNDSSRGAFFQPAGVTVALEMTPGTGKVIDVDQFKSKLQSFTDDKGTDLLAVKSNDPFYKPGFGHFQEKESHVKVEVQAAGLPAKGSTELSLSGKVIAMVAAESKEFTVENVDVKEGTALSFGDLTVKITKVKFGKGEFSQEEEFSVSISSTKELKAIAKLEFYDDQGARHEARWRSSWSGMGSYETEFVMKRKIEKSKVVATCWQNLKQVEIPVSVKVGLGL